MDTALAANLVTAIAGFGGALLGGGLTLIGGALQHRRETNREASREARARAVAAAETCYATLTTWREATTDDRGRIICEGLSPIENDQLRQLNSSLHGQCVFLPTYMKDRVTSARTILIDAQDIADAGLHYLPVHTIINYAAGRCQQELAAFMCNERLPPVQLEFRELLTAQTELRGMQLEARGSSDDLQKFNEDRVAFQRAHPELYRSDETKPGLLGRAFRRDRAD